jgi:RNA polymerase-binding transcription factor
MTKISSVCYDWSCQSKREGKSLSISDSRPGLLGGKEKGAMDANEGITYWDKLRLRAIEVERTIRHLEKERQEVEENTEWVDRAAYESRVSLLEGLTTLYRDEMEQIEKAHSRVEERSYGLCLACHEPIEADRLEIYPAAQFCFDCQNYRERLRRG